MKMRLTLQEKLRDLRYEKKVILADVSEATGIPVSTLARIEGNEDVRVGYQDVIDLAEYYEVSADYLFGLTDNRQHRNTAIDKLRLSDSAIEVLTESNLNNRLISEFLSHPDFPDLLRAMEIYIDKKVLPQMNTMNAMYKLAEDTIKENFEVAENDAVIGLLQQSVVNEDEYLRYRISERFNTVIKSMFDTHKKDPLPREQAEALQDMKDAAQLYTANKESPDRAKLTLLAKQLGLNVKHLSDEEVQVLIKALQHSEKFKKARKKKK